MTNSGKRSAVLGGLSAAVLFAAWRVYDRRSRERVVSFEGLDDPAVAEAFGRVAALPQMGLMRRLVARRAATLQPDGCAADLGCGTGHLAVTLARAASELQVTGIDLSPELLAAAEARARAAGLAHRIDFEEGDAAQIPFPDGALDLVVSTLSLHHWRDPVAVFDEIARVLPSGGSFLVFDLRRDMSAPFYLLLWFVTNCIVPRALRRVNEPLGSRNAAYTPSEAAHLVGQSRLAGWRVSCVPLWLTIEGVKT